MFKITKEGVTSTPQVEQYLQKELGKFVLCESDKEETTRLFLHRFDSITSALHKNGRRDIFITTEVICRKGFYLCSIKEFRTDKNGYLNMIVTPSKFLGEEVNEDCSAWTYLFLSGKFSTKYTCTSHHSRFNIRKLENIFSSRFSKRYEYYPKGDCETLPCFLLNEFKSDKVSLEEISSALDEWYEIEKATREIIYGIGLENKTFLNKYPLLTSNAPKGELNSVASFDEVQNWLKAKQHEYKLKAGSASEILDRVEIGLKRQEISTRHNNAI